MCEIARQGQDGVQPLHFANDVCLRDGFDLQECLYMRMTV